MVYGYLWWTNDTGSINSRVQWQLPWQNVTDVTQSMTVLLFCCCFRWQVEGGEDISIDVHTVDQGHVYICSCLYCNCGWVAGWDTKRPVPQCLRFTKQDHKQSTRLCEGVEKNVSVYFCPCAHTALYTWSREWLQYTAVHIHFLWADLNSPQNKTDSPALTSVRPFNIYNLWNTEWDIDKFLE